MDKRVLLATVVSMGVVLIWIAFAKPQAKTETQGQTQTQTPATTPATTTAQTTTKTDRPAPTPTPTPTTSSDQGADKGEAVETVVEEARHYKATFGNEGAAPKSWVLLDAQYKEDNPRESNKTAQPIDLVRTHSPNLPLQVTFPASAFSVPVDAKWTVAAPGADGALVYSFQNESVRVEKRFVPVPRTYQLRLLVTVENLSDKPQSHHFQIQMHGWHDPSVKQGGMFSKRVSQAQGLCQIGGKLKRGSLDDLLKKGIDELGNVLWVGVGEQYFLDAVALKPSDETKRCNVFAASDGTISSILTVGERQVAPHGKTEYELTAFLGPKILSQLDAATVGGAPAHFGDVIEYGLWGLTEWLARPMLAVLKGIHYAVFNWGLAIIVLTMLLKAVTWFPTQSSMKSMKAMAKLKPEMDKLKERFGADKNQLNLATMELYKKHGVNPLGGCLPILIQMPIYIALYSMLGNSVELYRSPFVGWIRDLTAADPYFVLPVLTGVLMFVQQKTQPTPPDPQQKTMMYMMPVMFTAFSIFLPAGLTIYILTNTVLTFLQQWWMNRHDKPARPQKVAIKPARA